MKNLHLLIGFIAFLIIFLFWGGNPFFDAIAIAAVVVYWWITEPIPLYLTATVPMILGPLLGIVSVEELESAYGDNMVFLFFGGFVIALAIEKWNLHRKIAALIVKRTGTSPAGVLLGFIVSTAFLSMWLSNTGTAIMMLPMAITVINSLPENETTNKFSVALLLAVAYSASFGGTATLIGSPPNIQMSGIVQNNYGITIDFLTWSSIGFPFCVIMLAILYFYLKWRFIGSNKEKMEVVIEDAVGLSKNQKVVLIVFFCTILFWIFKQLINDTFHWKLSDTQIALMGAFLLFVLPSSENKKEAILTWKDTKELPWGVLLLFGGGLALAKILSNGGVLKFFAEWVAQSQFNTYLTFISVLVVASIFLSELMSNLALVTIIVPIIAQLGIEMGYSILSLCVPVTLAASCGFMLPMATPPNAIVFATGKLHVKTMAKVGFALNILSAIVIVLIAYIVSVVSPL